MCKKVTMLVRTDKFRASRIMEERVRKTENIEILVKHQLLKQWVMDKLLMQLSKNNVTGEERDSSYWFLRSYWS